MDQLELEWQNYDRFRGKIRVSSKQGVYKVQFPVSEMGREIRVATTMQLTQFPVVVNHATTGHNDKIHTRITRDSPVLYARDLHDCYFGLFQNNASASILLRIAVCTRRASSLTMEASRHRTESI